MHYEKHIEIAQTHYLVITITDCYRSVSFGSSGNSEVQGMGELGLAVYQN